MSETSTPALEFAASLIGQPGSRYRLPTPALVLDRQALDRNITRMATRARDAGIALRPHAKSHKSSFIAKRQIAAGAVGVCCAKLGEAEALARAGIESILLTSPIVSIPNARRLWALHRAVNGIMIVVDHREQVDVLDQESAVSRTPLDVLVDVDVGMSRTGVASVHAATNLAQHIAGSRRLRLRGVQSYAGHHQHILGLQPRAAATRDAAQRLRPIVEHIRGFVDGPMIVTGGGTGTFASDVECGVLNELQPGSYVFMDREYREALNGDLDGAFESSLFVQAQVISVNAPRFVTVDAGLKAFATDVSKPRPVTNGFEGSEYLFMGDEHGGVTRPAGDIRLGDRVEFEVPHCDPTVDRHDHYFVVDGDVLTSIIPIEARGRSS